MAWIDEVRRYDLEEMRRFLGYRTQNELVQALGLSHHNIWRRRWVQKGTLGSCVDVVVGLGGELLGADLFECNGGRGKGGGRIYGRFSDFEKKGI